MYDFESVLKDGKYTYDGVISYGDLQKLIKIAEENHLTAISPNEYISWLINNYMKK